MALWFDVKSEEAVYKTDSYYAAWQLGQGTVVECAYQAKQLTYRSWELPHDVLHPDTVCQDGTMPPKEGKY